MQHSTLKISFLLFLASIIGIASCNQPITYPEGGYNYPTKDSVTDTNFYFYPLINVFSRQDSFRMSSSWLYYKTFDEPNLSIAPHGEDIFRFTFEGFKYLPVIVVFTKTQMTIKTGSFDYMTYGMINENRLNEAEKKDFHFILRHYPYYSTNENDVHYRTHYVDSMINLHPKLLSISYYKSLLNKALLPGWRHIHSYTMKKIKLSYKEFKNLVSIINDSGYWKLPYSLPMISESMDGYGFSLEANTKSKYNYVSANCDSDPQTHFFAICREIAKCARLENQIEVWFQKPGELNHKQIIIKDVTLADIKPDSAVPHKNKKDKLKHN